MKNLLILVLATGLLAGCAGGGDAEAPAEQSDAPARVFIEVEAPAPLEMPEAVPVSSETDWAARTHNKEREVIEVLNIINPVAAYITKGFEQYGTKFSPTLHEEWDDTQVQLTAALTLYESCKERRDAGEADKQLFLDMEEVWQLLVKTGVAGVRAKSMIDGELSRIMG